jgi:shikimate dehydrogenase
MAAGGHHIVGLIGAGIGESLSPALHEREAARQGLSYEYRLLDIGELGRSAADLLAETRRDGYTGVNVTHPCKQLVVDHLDELSPEAGALEAVNTVVFAGGRAIGHNTDVTGFRESFERGLPCAPLDRVVLLGAGGAGAAVAHAALALGARRLTVVDVEPGRARELARRLRDDRVAAGDLDDLARADGLIHATPSGMAGHRGMPLPAHLLHERLWVADVVYRPLETELLRRAHEIGCRTLDGGGMAVFQAAASFALFTGLEPDRERMLHDFAELAEPVATAGGR